jgi:hypothetical protein
MSGTFWWNCVGNRQGIFRIDWLRGDESPSHKQSPEIPVPECSRGEANRRFTFALNGSGGRLNGGGVLAFE